MWNSISVILICFSLTANDIEHLFVWLLVICISSLEKCIFIFFALFKVGLFVLLLLNCYLIHFYGFIYIFILKILKIYVLSLDFLSSLDPPQMHMISKSAHLSELLFHWKFSLSIRKPGCYSFHLPFPLNPNNYYCFFIS